MRSTMIMALVLSALAGASLVGCSGDESGGAAPNDGDTGNDTGGGVDDIRVETLIDETYNIPGFKKYAWVAAAAAIRDPDREWTPSGLDIGAEIMFLVDRELRDRGCSPVVDAPDMVAIFAVGLDMKALDVKLDPEHGTREFEPSPKGGVIILLIHPRTREVFWAGRAIADVTAAPTLEDGKRRLEYAITTMFEDYPE